MHPFKIEDEVWMISFETENDFYLLAKQVIVELHEDYAVCEDDFNTFHAAYSDLFYSRSEALNVMLDKLHQLKNKSSLSS